MSAARLKKPSSFRRIWPTVDIQDIKSTNDCDAEITCSIWMPEAPTGYISLGCVASPGRMPPSSPSALCISTSLVTPCDLRDCITISLSDGYVDFKWVNIIPLLVVNCL